MDDLERRAQELADKIVKEMSERDYRLNGSELGYALGYEIARLEVRIENLEWRKNQAEAMDHNREGPCHKCGRVLGHYESKLIEAKHPHRIECKRCPIKQWEGIPKGWGYYTDG